MVSRDRWLLVTAALCVCVFFLALNLHFTKGELVLPLDDAYIYAQYARSIAEGHPLRFTPGAEPTAGVTGLLYPFLLAPFYAIGFKGALFPVVVFVLQSITFAASAVMAYEIAGGTAQRSVARLAGWLFVLSGPLAWGYLTGMEIGPFCLTWLAGTFALTRGKETLAIVLTALLTLIRPDGLVWAGLLWLFVPLLVPQGETRRHRRLSWLIPIGVGLIPIVVNILLTGGIAPSSGRPKSPFALPGHHLPTILQHATGFLIGAIKGLLSGVGGESIDAPINRLDTWAHVAPFTLILVVAALFPALIRAARTRRWDAASHCAAWLLTSLVWVAVSTGSSTHYFRYLLPAWPALVVLVAIGSSWITRPFATRGVSRGIAFWGVGAYLIGYSILGLTTFGLIYGKAAHGFARQSVDCARWIDQNLPADARIAALDAGILPYYSNREFFDLYGLTTRAMHDVTVFAAEDEGSKFEVMEALPESRRPTHFVLHAKRGHSSDRQPFGALMQRGTNDRARVLHSCDVLIPVPLTGRDLQVWPADWSIVDSGDAPQLVLTDADPDRVVDRIDFADPVSERAHFMSFEPEAPGFLGINRIARHVSPSGRIVVDGRGIAGKLTVRLAGLEPGRDTRIRLRIEPLARETGIDVSIDSLPPVRWTLPPDSRDSFVEPAFEIDGGAIRNDSIELTLSGRLKLFHLWAIQ